MRTVYKVYLSVFDFRSTEMSSGVLRQVWCWKESKASVSQLMDEEHYNNFIFFNWKNDGHETTCP